MKQENKRSMSKPESIYMWDNVDKTIQRIESRIDLINRRTDLYDPQYFPQDNEYCSLKYSHIIGEFVPMKEPHDFMYCKDDQDSALSS